MQPWPQTTGKERKPMIKVLANQADFDSEVKTGNVLVDFNATWCGPCRMMSQVFDSLEGDYPDVKILKVDVDKFPELSNRFGISSIPNMIFFKAGQKAKVKIEGADQDSLIGSLPEDEFREVLDNTFGK